MGMIIWARAEGAAKRAAARRALKEKDLGGFMMETSHIKRGVPVKKTHVGSFTKLRPKWALI
jgi:hypothetical protein